MLAARPVIVAGSAAEWAVRVLTAAAVDAVAAAPGIPVAAAVAAIAARRRRAGATSSRSPSPLYLRPPDTGPIDVGRRSR
jgi:tRNA A37 threonylcarbamoyladenosine modification protein TsaB